MFKKIALTALILVAGVIAFKKFAPNCCVRKDNSLEGQISSLKQRIDKLATQAPKHRQAIAKEAVALDEYDAEIVALNEVLKKKEQRITTMKNDLKPEVQFVKYGDQSFSRDQVLEQIKRDVTEFKNAKEQLAAKKQLRDNTLAKLNAEKDKFIAFQTTLSELTVKLDKMEAELKKVRAAQIRSKEPLDESELSKIKADMTKLERNIKVEGKVADQVKDLPGEVNPEAKPKEKDVLEEVETLFPEKNPLVEKK